ncbi:MAG: pyridoxine 5'-phosphate synthase [Rhodospirillaceae bacterium]|nr:pyridoxine 5'-phosphate synthase [Rhodospirillaceae bacterium]
MSQKTQRVIDLGVNVDHVATLRQARGTDYPDPVECAIIAENAGADSITIHLREDRRHIQDCDLARMQESVNTRVNLEMAVTEEMIQIALATQPADCCLVPEKREELTTEGGLNILNQTQKVKNAVLRLQEAGIRVSLFIDPDLDQLDAAVESGVSVVELHTGTYADSKQHNDVTREFKRIQRAADFGRNLGLTIHAGHGLNYHNVKPIASLIPIVELNIGHSIISRALFVGMQKAVSTMKELMQEGRGA